MFSGWEHFTSSHTGEELFQEPLARQDDSLSPTKIYPLLHLKKRKNIECNLFSITLSVPRISKIIGNLHILGNFSFSLLK
jgi:hypothetical protein